MDKKKKRERKKRTPLWFILVIGLMLSCYVGLTIRGIYEKLFGEPDTYEFSNDEARNSLLEDFGLDLPQDAENIHVNRYQPYDSIMALRSRVSFVASESEMLLWLSDTCTLSNLSSSFADSILTPSVFQWDEAPDWWQPERANEIILQTGCVVPENHHIYFLLIDTDNDMWIAYMYISFP